MNILKTHYYSLIFKLDSDAPKKWKEKWMEFKKVCESGESKNKYIAIDIKSHCRLEQNRKLDHMHQVEGGLKYGNDKEIKFRYNWKMDNVYPPMENDEHIIMDEIYGEWTYEELDDLIYGFIKMTRDHVFKDMRECVKGYIQLRNKDSDSEDYISE